MWGRLFHRSSDTVLPQGGPVEAQKSTKRAMLRPEGEVSQELYIPNAEIGVLAGAWGWVAGSSACAVLAPSAIAAARENLDFLPDAGARALHVSQK